MRSSGRPSSEHLQVAAARLAVVEELEHRCRSPDVAAAGGADLGPGVALRGLDEDAVQAEALDVAGVAAHLRGLPAAFVAADAHTLVAIAAPRGDGHHEAVARVAEARLQA
jgi:hypothetical protein